MSSTNVTGKVLAIWWPVMAFVTFGFEHSIANMFFIPLAIFEGANITWVSFVINNLVPATLGNIVGGTLLVGAAYWYLYGKEKTQTSIEMKEQQLKHLSLTKNKVNPSRILEQTR